MLALGTGLIVLITVAGVGLGFVGGWFCFKYARRKNIFNDTDRSTFKISFSERKPPRKN